MADKKKRHYDFSLAARSALLNSREYLTSCVLFREDLKCSRFFLSAIFSSLLKTSVIQILSEQDAGSQIFARI